MLKEKMMTGAFSLSFCLLKKKQFINDINNKII